MGAAEQQPKKIGIWSLQSKATFSQIQALIVKRRTKTAQTQWNRGVFKTRRYHKSKPHFLAKGAAEQQPKKTGIWGPPNKAILSHICTRPAPAPKLRPRSFDPEALTPKLRPRSFDPETSTPKSRPRSFDPAALTRKLRPRSLDPEASTRKLPPGSFDPDASTRKLPPGSFHPEASTRKLPPGSFHPEASTPKL